MYNYGCCVIQVNLTITETVAELKN